MIDSESSVDVLNDAEHMISIHKAKKPLKLHCNAECVKITKKGWFGEIKVWYHLSGIAYILLLKTLKERHHITYASQDTNEVFKVDTDKDTVTFIPCESRLH